MPKTPASPRLDVTDPYMSIGAVADYLGTNRALVYRLMREQRLPYVIVGKRRRVLQSDVKAIIQEAD